MALPHSYPLVIFTLGVTLFTVLHAAPTCASPIGDGMVLQRGMPVPLCGLAGPGERITVRLCGQEASATADERGRWQLTMGPFEAGGPYEMEIAGREVRTVRNVLVGEVWVCSGQSNMEWAVSWSRDAAKEMSGANYPQIRLLKVPHVAAAEPQDDVTAEWRECSPESVRDFSAVGYFFGRRLHQELGVPIGLIDASWGGSPAQSWTSLEVLRADPRLAQFAGWYDGAMAAFPQALDAYRKSLSAWVTEALEAPARGLQPPAPPQPPMGPGNSWLPSSLYNGMIRPLRSYAIKGAIWYQGESNADGAYQYRTLFPAMIADWRRAWGQGDFPFYFVQLAAYMPVQTEPAEQSAWAELREAQLMALAVPNTGMASAIDIGDVDDIHPRNKQEVGRRLALWALAKTYGRDLVCSGPIYESMSAEGNKARLRFGYVGGGLKARDERLSGFAVAGADQRFEWAEARIEGDTVVVWNDKVPQPVAVRYSWANNPIGNLYNTEGLPASPFRTDDWPGVTQK